MTHPAKSLALAAGIGLAVTWLGLSVAYFTPYPVGFFITTFAFAAYVAGRALPPGTQYLRVFQFVGATAFMGYSLI